MHQEITRKIIRSAGFSGKVPRRKVLMSSEKRRPGTVFLNILRRTLNFGKKNYLMMRVSLILLTAMDIKKNWQKKHTEMKPKNLMSIIEPGGSSVMVCLMVAFKDTRGVLRESFNFNESHSFHVINSN